MGAILYDYYMYSAFHGAFSIIVVVVVDGRVPQDLLRKDFSYLPFFGLVGSGVLVAEIAFILDCLFRFLHHLIMARTYANRLALGIEYFSKYSFSFQLVH